MKHASRGLVTALMLVACNSAWATSWCTVTHILFNDEATKLDKEGEPFQIGKLDERGYSLQVIKGDDRSTYAYLRTITRDGVDFREFRHGRMTFLLSLPVRGPMMIYQQFITDATGVRRGFAGMCSG